MRITCSVRSFAMTVFGSIVRIASSNSPSDNKMEDKYAVKSNDDGYSRGRLFLSWNVIKVCDIKRE